MFESLKERGLSIPDLVRSDGHTDIREAVLKCFPGSAWKYCHVHFMRNMMKRIPRKHWSGIGIVKQALENPDLLPIAQEYLMRNNMEIKRITRRIGAFPSKQSLLRVLFFILMDLDEEWMTGRKYIKEEVD